MYFILGQKSVLFLVCSALPLLYKYTAPLNGYTQPELDSLQKFSVLLPILNVAPQSTLSPNQNLRPPISTAAPYSLSAKILDIRNQIHLTDYEFSHTTSD
jgi:hypothetical protein